MLQNCNKNGADGSPRIGGQKAEDKLEDGESQFELGKLLFVDDQVGNESLYFSRSFGFSIFPVGLRGTFPKMMRRGRLKCASV